MASRRQHRQWAGLGGAGLLSLAMLSCSGLEQRTGTLAPPRAIVALSESGGWAEDLTLPLGRSGGYHTLHVEVDGQRAGRWLRQHGVEIPLGNNDEVNATIELSPLTAIRPSDLEGADLPEEVERGQEVTL